MVIVKKLDNDLVVIEMCVSDFALLTTMVGYSCSAASARGHDKAFKMFTKFAKSFLDASKRVTDGRRTNASQTRQDKH